MEISEAGPEDLQFLVDLVIDVAQEDIFPYLSQAGVDYFLSIVGTELKQVLEQPERRAYKAVIGGNIVGFGIICHGYYITHLFVAKEAQGCGLGQRLLNLLLANATKSVIELWSSLNALSFYLRNGFEAQGDEQEMNGIRYVPMKRILPKPVDEVI
ncbi:GNAT family N-acetyltransferase [Vibrio mangrovi]|uniref:Acetyltransferase (GNAT) family protein n=1 Tax=Vibrio mangrovi TaxID=474394 RepID=A0A1Y6IRV6_9VIBR|nr:GNAT family N-acetyltransferase [Vibrio mangrovi]MDW6004407.1 GNAT family N-acetyltransferase [Vibrio mangrovi]SMR98793.1 Acetyltransferase (GNAT) family protein [Vibrio mangrovi]